MFSEIARYGRKNKANNARSHLRSSARNPLDNAVKYGRAGRAAAETRYIGHGPPWAVRHVACAL
jgi:hypothetical protein